MENQQYKYRFTVFTSTFNNSENLPKLYNNLLNQTYKDFEWVVVNDGSSDNTIEIMNHLISLNELNISFITYAENGGKHKAWREGLKRFSGRYVISADDDDPLLPDMLEIHNRHWTNLENSENYEDFWEVKSRCVDTNNNLIGKPLPSPLYDSDYLTLQFKDKNRCEMHGSRKVEVLRAEASIPPFLFETECSNFPEVIRWSRAAKKYKTRYVSEVTRVYEPNPNGLCKNTISKRQKYNTLVQCGYMLKEHSGLLRRYDLISYFKYVLLLSRASVQLNQNRKNIFQLSPLDYTLFLVGRIPFFIKEKLTE